MPTAPPPISKQAEMQRLDAFIASLPEDSYLRPWLTTERDAIESDLRNDTFPERRPSQVWEHCQRLKLEAETAARQVTEQATREADSILSAARSRATASLESAASHLRKALLQVE